jgi:hypothetical protein
VLFTLADVCLDSRLRTSVGTSVSMDLLFQLATSRLDTHGRRYSLLPIAFSYPHATYLPSIPFMQSQLGWLPLAYVVSGRSRYARLVLSRLVIDSTRNANALLRLQGHHMLLECAAGELWSDAARAIAQILWMAEQGQVDADHQGEAGITKALVAGGGLHSVLRLAGQSAAVEDSLLVAKALNTLCQDTQLHADVLQIGADHGGGGGRGQGAQVPHDSAIRTMVKLERSAHTQSRMSYDRHGEVKRYFRAKILLSIKFS